MDSDVNTEDRGPLLVAVSWLLVTVSVIFLSLRIHCKFKRKRNLWWDDYILILSWLCLFIDSCCLTYNTTLGFGKHFLAINPEVLPKVDLMGTISGAFAIYAVIFSKTSFAITLLRISESKTRILLWFIIISVNIALGGSVLIPWIQCKPLEKNWNIMIPGKCWNPKIFSYYGIVAAAYSGAMDILLAFIPWKIMWNLQMKEKIGVATAMSMGVFAGASAIIKSVYLQAVPNRDFSYVGAPVVLWCQVESAICIMAVSIPVLRVLLKEFLDSKRETDERTEQRSIQTYRTDTTSENAQAPSFAFLKEEEGMTSASASEREVVDWRTGSHDALP